MDLAEWSHKPGVCLRTTMLLLPKHSQHSLKASVIYRAAFYNHFGNQCFCPSQIVCRQVYPAETRRLLLDIVQFGSNCKPSCSVFVRIFVIEKFSNTDPANIAPKLVADGEEIDDRGCECVTGVLRIVRRWSTEDMVSKELYDIFATFSISISSRERGGVKAIFRIFPGFLLSQYAFHDCCVTLKELAKLNLADKV